MAQSEENRRELQVFKNELQQYGDIVRITHHNLTPDDNPNVANATLSDGEKVAIPYLEVDHDFLRTLGIELIEGRDFSREFAADEIQSVIVNETLVRTLDLGEPVGAILPIRILAYYAMHRWLQDFAYRIDLGVGIFLLGGGSTLLVVLLVVGALALKAALENPVDALRYE